MHLLEKLLHGVIATHIATVFHSIHLASPCTNSMGVVFIQHAALHDHDDKIA